MINVTKSALPPLDEYIEEIKELWNSRWLTNMGAKYNQLQTELKKYLNVDNVRLLVNGHMSLELALQALDMKGEVITTPFTFVSTTNAIIRSGLKPVFCDIFYEDYTIDVTKIEELITEKTVAIMPVHVYGNICDVAAISQLAKKYNLAVIYDAAHAFGEKLNGVGVGNFGDVSCYSFHATKVFHTIEGGAVCCKDESLAEKIRVLSDFGINEADQFSYVGTNGKMNEFCAAMGLCNLRHVDEYILQRKKLSDRYSDRLSNVEGIKLNMDNSNIERNYSYYPVVLDEKKLGYDRDQLCEKLKKNDINARKYFYPLTSAVVCSGDCAQTPIAHYISERVLTLPLYPELDLADVDYICDLIMEGIA